MADEFKIKVNLEGEEEGQFGQENIREQFQDQFDEIRGLSERISQIVDDPSEEDVEEEPDLFDSVNPATFIQDTLSTFLGNFSALAIWDTLTKTIETLIQSFDRFRDSIAEFSPEVQLQENLNRQAEILQSIDINAEIGDQLANFTESQGEFSRAVRELFAQLFKLLEPFISRVIDFITFLIESVSYIIELINSIVEFISELAFLKKIHEVLVTILNLIPWNKPQPPGNAPNGLNAEIEKMFSDLTLIP